MVVVNSAAQAHLHHDVVWVSTALAVALLPSLLKGVTRWFVWLWRSWAVGVNLPAARRGAGLIVVVR